jgi:tetratricopeptide (TPR) repeat protein
VTRKLAHAGVLGIFLAVVLPARPSQGTPAQNQNKPNQNNSTQPPPAVTKGDSDTDDLPEEDESLKPRVYPFNPLEAERDIKVGNFYMHKGDHSGYVAAVGRYQDATKYNPTSAEAFFRLGEAEEKLKHAGKAKAAFQRVLTIAPDTKLARDAKKKLNGVE